MARKGDMARVPAADLFPTEEPVLEDLIGRGPDVEALTRALENRMHRILAEPRRLGKTTTCRASLHRLREDGFYIVGVDLWEISDQAELASTLVAQTIANRPAFKRLPHVLRESGKKLSDVIQLATSTKLSDELGQEVEIAWKPSLADRDPRRYMRYALELPQAIAEADNKRIIVFFDEFQNVLDLEEPKKPQALQKLMRSVFMASNRVSYMFAGSIKHMMQEIFSADAPLGSFGGFHELSSISADQWHEGIRDRLARDKTTISTDALTLLTELSELHPRATMLIAQQAYLGAVIQTTHTIDSALVRLGHAEARRHDRLRHETMIGHVRKLGGKTTGPLAMRVLKQIAREEPIYAGVADEDKPAIGRAANALRDGGYVVSKGRGQGWRITDPLFRLHVAELGPGSAD